MSKTTHVKPQFYAYCLIEMKEIAKVNGYNLVVHGSMNRDLDLIAIPWNNEPRPELELIHELSKFLTGKRATDKLWKEQYMFTSLPGGRHNYVIHLNRGGYKRTQHGEITDPVEFTPDPEYYVDISVTPLVVSPS